MDHYFRYYFPTAIVFEILLASPCDPLWRVSHWVRFFVILFANRHTAEVVTL